MTSIFIVLSSQKTHINNIMGELLYVCCNNDTMYKIFTTQNVMNELFQNQSLWWFVNTLVCLSVTGSNNRLPRHGLLTCNVIIAGFVEFSHVELKADDGKHEDSHKQQQSNLQQGDHGLHNRLEHHLQAWRTRQPQEL